MLIKATICLSLVVLSNCQSVSRDVNTDQGTVRGYNVDDDEVVSFYGIPYATAPRGEDRFKAALPGPTWTDIFEATTRGIVCPQGLGPIEGTGSNTTTFDCLVMNIFIPTTVQTNLPVYFYIHGGAYQYGHALEVTHENMVKRGVVVVNFNYRVGLHGLLCLNNEYAPGNAGMKDTVAALRWVRRNIVNFGGNPDQITVGGSSAGSSAAEIQLLSQMTTGLFERLILESGSTLAWDFVTTTPLHIAERFANDRGVYTNENVTLLEEYFRSLTDEQMDEQFASDHRNIGFVPCIETHDLPGVEKFLDARPIDIIREQRFEPRPILSGYTTLEGVLYYYRYNTDTPLMLANLTDFLPSDIEFRSEEHRDEVTQKVRDYYFPTGEITVAGHIDYFSDILFTYPHYLGARLYAEIGVPIYLYLFSFNGTVNMPIVYTSPVYGPGHVAQSLYLYYWIDEAPVVYANMDEADYLTQDRLRAMWYNFIVYGQPILERTELLDVDWEPFDNERENFLDIDTELSVGSRPLAENMAFWDEIYGYFQSELEPTSSPEESEPTPAPTTQATTEPVPDSGVALKLSLAMVLGMSFFVIMN